MEAQKAREQDEYKENVKDKKSRKFGFFVSISFKIVLIICKVILTNKRY